MNQSKFSGIDGKRVLITGATTGLGFAMAKALAAANARVLVTGRDHTRVDSAVSALRRVSPEVMGSVMDVRAENSISQVLERMAQAWAGIDVLVNNAGIGMQTVNPHFFTDPMPFWDILTEKFRDLIDTNLTGYFLAAKKAAPFFIKQGGGRIINITTSLETMRRKGFVPYGPSRAASEALSHIMAEDLKPFGITVNLLLPGGATSSAMVPDDIPSNIRSQLLPADIMADPILFLCSDASKGVNDERIIAKDFPQWLAGRVSN